MVHRTSQFIVITLMLFLAACQVNTLNATPSPSPMIEAPAISTLILPSNTEDTPMPSETPAATATQDEGRDFSSLEDALIEGVDWYILIQDASSSEILFESNPDTPFPPASMIKIPTAMAVLSILEDQGRTLEDLKTNGINGRNFDSLLEAMVVRSEESATDALEYFARGDNQLRKKLDLWGLSNTKYDPRTSTATDLLRALELLNTGKAIDEQSRQYLLSLMGAFTENDQILLGKLTDQIPDCKFLNKRGTMLSPTIVSDMGILSCGDRSWYLVVAGTPSMDSTANFEDIQESIETFAIAFASLIR